MEQRSPAAKHRKPRKLTALGPSAAVAAAVRRHQAHLSGMAGKKITQGAAVLDALTVGLRSLGLLPAEEKE